MQPVIGISSEGRRSHVFGQNRSRYSSGIRAVFSGAPAAASKWMAREVDLERMAREVREGFLRNSKGARPEFERVLSGMREKSEQNLRGNQTVVDVSSKWRRAQLERNLSRFQTVLETSWNGFGIRGFRSIPLRFRSDSARIALATT